MKDLVKKEIEELIEYYHLNSSIEEFINKNDNKYWSVFSRYKVLSEDFIREFQDYVDWKEISWNQILSESFIEEFKEKVNWISICRKQKLSKDFIIKFKSKLDLDDMLDWNKINKEFYNHLKWMNIVQKQDLKL